jgi:Ca-activated chloride channel family protein
METTMNNYALKIMALSAVTVLLVGGCTSGAVDQDTVIGQPPEPQVNPAGNARQESDRVHEVTQGRRVQEAELQPGTVAGTPRETPQKNAAAVSMYKHSQDAGHHLAVPTTPDFRRAVEPLNRENYAHFTDNPLRVVAKSPYSTFSVDVDTGAYSNMRRMLNAGSRPVRDAIRTEELVNYFAYDYPRPHDRNTPFAVITEVGPTPWNPDTQLLHIGIQGYDVDRRAMPDANLVFLVDVSGSMQSADKLELLKAGLKLLARQLNANDRVTLVVYAGASGVVLEPTAGDRSATISTAIDGLSAGGSTNGGAGIRLAYAKAREAFIKGGINRVILATDGDFNVGTTDFDMLKQLVEEQRASGIGLTTLGFGAGNYNDHLMEQLADAGNGNYAYIDTLGEANKSLVQQMSSTLLTIASDVKIQVEFNPATVAEYRLVGYENRALLREDFNNDKVDAGEIGAGHSVTAIYEIALTGSRGQLLDKSRYQHSASAKKRAGKELALVRVRYKLPGKTASRLIEQPVLKAEISPRLVNTSERYRFSAAVAGFGQVLRGGRYTRDFGYDDVLELARAARGADPFGYRGEFLQLVNLAAAL